jgi:hypothetical protein
MGGGSLQNAMSILMMASGFGMMGNSKIKIFD